MIGYLKGTAKHVFADSLILEVNGVGYKVYTDTVSTLPNTEQELLIYTHITQDNWQLWGLRTIDELKVFELLLSVSGVGPRSAASLIFGLGINQIVAAVNNKQPAQLKVSGVGPKTAEKIVIELRDKVTDLGNADATLASSSANGGLRQDLESALVNLGYSNLEARQMAQAVEITEQSDIGSLIKQALQKS